MNWRQNFLKLWLQPIDKIRLEAFRILIGLSLLNYMIFRWQYADEWLTNSGFHVSPANLPYFDTHVPLLSLKMLPWFGLFYFGAITAFIAGYRVKWSSWLVLAGLLYVSAADQLAFFSPNKVLIIAIFVYACATICGNTRRQEDMNTTTSAWSVRVLQATIIIHLFMAGWAKVSYGGEWIDNPFVLWTQAQGTYRTDFAAFLLNYLPGWGWALMQYSALLFELLVPYLFISKNLRWIGILWGCAFQVMIALTMQHLIYFNLIIMSFFVLFVRDVHLHKIRSFFSNLNRSTAVSVK